MAHLRSVAACADGQAVQQLRSLIYGVGPVDHQTRGNDHPHHDELSDRVLADFNVH